MVPTLTLNSGQTIPQIGLGFWQVRDPEQFATAFSAAIQAGYSHFDTAQAYDNEHLLGKAWRQADLSRDSLFITTKIAVEHFMKVKQSFAESLEDLQTDYVDLLLLHFPVPGLRTQAWHTLEAFLAEGKARSIGVSNFTIRHLEGLAKHSKIVPAVNQVEIHIFLQQPELLEYCRDKGIVVEAYSPLAHARQTDNVVVQAIAKKHAKSYAQIMLRWCLEQNLVVLPKSVTPSRIAENIVLFDFSLDETDLAQLRQLNSNLRTCWNPTFVP